MNRNNLVEMIFTFSDGENQRTIGIGAQGGIDAVNASRSIPEIRLTENRLVVYEDAIIYNSAPPPDYDISIPLDFDLSLIVVGYQSQIVQDLPLFAIGTVQLIEPPTGMHTVVRIESIDF